MGNTKNDERRTRIESNPEIEALLNSLLKMVSADTAILYTYVDEKDVEVTEIIDLLSKSSMVNNKKCSFHDDVINDTYIGKIGLKEVIKEFRSGRLDVSPNSKNWSALEKLRKSIRVLRFCDLAEKQDEDSRWDFNYIKRPPKYLVISNEMLKPPYRSDGENPGIPIPFEGVTGYFCRVNGRIDKLLERDKKQGESKTQRAKEKNAGDDEEKKNLEYLGLCGESPASWLLPRKSISQCPAHSNFGEDLTVFSNYDSHHASFLLLATKDKNDGSGKDGSGRRKGIGENERMIGCVRFEYYPEGKKEKTNEIGGTEADQSVWREEIGKISQSALVSLIVNEVETILEKQKENSYSEQFHCLEPILQRLIEVGINIKREINGIPKGRGDDRQDYQIIRAVHERIEHLFYVLKRNTYYGDAIIKRITFFIADLLDSLGLPQDIYLNIWKNLEKHEDLMLYDLRDYRDHLMHQFHVFVLGYIIIHKSGIDHFWKIMKEKYGDKNIDCPNGAVPAFSRADVIRVWTLISFFHDCGYAFEKLSDGFESFTLKVIKSALRADFHWAEFFLKNNDIPSHLQSMSKYFNVCPKYKNEFKEIDLYRILLNNAIMRRDHGVISAIILMQQYSNHGKAYLIKKQNSEGELEYEPVKNIDALVNIAAVTISLHNYPIFNDISQGGNPTICMEMNPFAFLLVFCDTAQEWGRKKNSKDELAMASPSLGVLEIVKTDKDNGLKVVIELFYSPGRSGVKPQMHTIKNRTSTTKLIFNSTHKSKFQVVYNIRGTCCTEKFSECYCDEKDNE